MKKQLFIILLFTLWGLACYGQDCENCYYWKDCRKSTDRLCDIYGQPKNITMGIYDTLRYNIVFYGNNDYIIAFCADRAYYPLNIRLVRPSTHEILYDNETERYPRTLYVGFNNTQNCIIEVILLSEQLKKEKLSDKNNIGLGMLIQVKKHSSQQDELYDSKK